MSEDETDRDQTDEKPDTEVAKHAAPDPSLGDQLADLKEKQAADAVAQVDANIADLKKLIADTDSAEEAYAKIHQKLKDQETQLKSERDTVAKSLKEALGDTAIKAVKQIVSSKVKAVHDAVSARDMAKTAADNAKEAAETHAVALAEAKAVLEIWRKPGDSIGKRLKAAAALLTEIKSLRNASRRGEAYWKLALGGHADVPGQEFLNEVLSRPPEVVDPGDLRGRIREAWKGFRDARKDAAEATATLAAAEADLKAKEAVLADLSKKLITAITDALTEREGASHAA